MHVCKNENPIKRDGSELFENCKQHKTYLTFVRPHNLKYTNIMKPI